MYFNLYKDYFVNIIYILGLVDCLLLIKILLCKYWHKRLNILNQTLIVN